MASASFLVGILPLTLSLSSRQLRLISALGTGVLVGTSLIVIIPEGIETLYSASGSSHSHHERAILRRTTQTDLFPGSFKHDIWRRDTTAIPLDIGLDAAHCLNKRQESSDSFTTTQEQEDKLDSTDPEDQPLPEHEHAGYDSESSYDPHAWVGISLTTGFILMYLIDTLPRHATTPSQPQRFQINMNQFSFTRTRTSSTPTAPSVDQHNDHTSSSRPSSTTVGLVIHALADGIALGASSTTTTRLSFIIFIALMIHKAPAAFGLTSVLLKQGLSKRAARAHLIVFSLAAPIGALLTWGAAHLLGYSSSALGSSTSTEFATGVLLLFSGGTFLYVAMHTMQENGSAHDHGAELGQANGYSGVPMTDLYEETAPMGTAKREGGAFMDTLVTVGGMLLPLLTQFGHGH
ncbi:hypothetical protein LTR37_015902 [Vermiconidia calcicola]|uniref:Uncharacterized protein n=1 Tax=Vermiconidia calcicola TaxID=1690605 RepID=A0ACC3MPI7_9PEZI|nr:hypothetical protein LTR37_015902 [Vermiconidia calcicola]